jgi:hypothetical protein
MEAYYNALAQQDASLAANAQQAGQQNVAFGAGLFGSGSNLLNQYQSGQTNALAPFQNYLTASQGIEQMGQQPLTLGAGLGGQAAAYGANVGQSLLTGGLNAARTQQAGSGYDPLAGLLTGLSGNQQFSQGLQNYFGTPSRGSTFSDDYQRNIPVNNQSSGYF